MVNNSLNVLYASNDNYSRHLSTSLYSLLENNSSFKDISIYVLTLGLSTENKEKLITITNKFNRNLNFINMDNIRSKFKMDFDIGGFDISIMLRLFVGEVLSDDIDRILYLDCDTVVLNSVYDLWNTNLNSNIIGAVYEPTIYKKVKDSIDLNEDDPYFNSGVLLIDLNKWKNGNIQSKLLDFYKKKNGKLFASDQDLINGVLKGNIQYLSPKYNFFTNFYYFPYKELVKQSPLYSNISYEEFKTSKANPTILHYLGDERPWIAGNLNHYRKHYEHYLSLTPYKGYPKEEGKRLYLLAYHMVELVTFVFPSFRKFISNVIGMKLIENRKT